jgi:hypothetical protein
MGVNSASMIPTDSQSGNKLTNLRRSQRVCLSLPILVFRDGPGKKGAPEETQTLIVNEHGALMRLALTVEMGQLLRIKNAKTLEELVCRCISAPIYRANGKWASSLKMLLRDFGELHFRRQIGARVAPKLSLPRSTCRARMRPRRKQPAHRPKLTGN